MNLNELKSTGVEIPRENLKSFKGGHSCRGEINLGIVSIRIGKRGCANGDAIHWFWETH